MHITTKREDPDRLSGDKSVCVREGRTVLGLGLCQSYGRVQWGYCSCNHLCGSIWRPEEEQMSLSLHLMRHNKEGRYGCRGTNI